MRPVIRIEFGPDSAYELRLEEGSLGYDFATLFVEVLNPFLPLDAAERGYTFHLLSTEDASGAPLGGIRISKLIEEGRVKIRVEDEQGRTVEPEPELLERIVLLVHEPAQAEAPFEVVVLPSQETQPMASAQPTAASVALPASRDEFSLRIHVYGDAMAKARRHAESTTRIEVGGICVGYQSYDGPGVLVVTITDTFPALHTLNHRASITFTADTWSEAGRVIARDYEPFGEVMVGWYHTHPGYGIFLSSYDLFIHEHFFTQPWHMALVFDPVAHTSGFFGWNNRSAVSRMPNNLISYLPGSAPRPRPAPVAASEEPEAAQAQERAGPSATQPERPSLPRAEEGTPETPGEP